MVEPVELSAVLNVEALTKGLELISPGNLLPSRVAVNAVAGSSRFLQVLGASLATGYRPRIIQQISVPKLGVTTRPAADMPVEDHVSYASLALFLKDRVHADLVNFTGSISEGQTYREFEQFPLSVPNARYVLEADAASFYEYVAHDQLGYELVGLTGEAAAVEALLELLEGWLGVPRGLPQGPDASAILADIYISPVGRALARAGIEFSRYSDDFRIPVTSWSEARRAQLLLESSMRSIGLVIAPGKLRTPKIEKYRSYVNEFEGSPEADEYVSMDTGPRPISEAELLESGAVVTAELARKEVDFEATRALRKSLLNCPGMVGDSGTWE